jgi:hypothetical protein
MSNGAPSGKKYHQIVVPDHAVKPETSGSSFLRTGTFPSLTDPTKQPPGFRESLALARQAGDHHLKTGGSWHHVDGNRIETTTGRKVEVIAGSYVAHRGPGNSPGPNFSATWATNSYTQVGSFDTPIGWTPSSFPAGDSQPPGTSPEEPPENFVETLSYDYDGARMSGTDPNPVVESTQLNPPASPTPVLISNNLLQNGDVVTVTWGQRILTYQGSANQVAPLVYAETQAGTIVNKSYAHTGNITTFIHAVGDSSCVWQDTVAKAITTTQEAVAITVANTATNLFTNNFGTQEVLNLGPAVVTATAAAQVSTFTAAAQVSTVTAAAALLTVNVGVSTTVSVPADTTIKNIEEEINAVRTDVTATQNQVNALHNTLASTLTAVSAVADHVSGTDTALSNARLYLDTNLMLLNSMTLLGP